MSKREACSEYQLIHNRKRPLVVPAISLLVKNMRCTPLRRISLFVRPAARAPIMLAFSSAGTPALIVSDIRGRAKAVATFIVVYSPFICAV